MDLRSKAEEFARKLVRKHKEQVWIHSLSSECVEIDRADSVRSEFDTNNAELIVLSSDGRNDRNRIGGKKRRFELFLFADSVRKQTAKPVKVSKYNLLLADDLQETHNHLLGDTFAIMEFRYSRKAQFRNINAIVARFHAIHA